MRNKNINKILILIFLILILITCKKTNKMEEALTEFSEVTIEEESDNSSKPIEYDNLNDIFIANDIEIKEYNAVELNKIGYGLYEKKKYNEAEIVFREAVNKDPNYLYANYNLACMLSLSLKDSKDEAADIEEIFKLLEKCINIDSKRVDKIKTDSDLDNVRNYEGYHELMDKYDIFIPEEGSFIGYFVSSGHVEFSESIVFKKENGEKISFSAFSSEFDNSDFFIYKENPDNEQFPLIETNSVNIGKKYKVYYRKDMVYNEWAGDEVESYILEKAEKL